MPTNKNIQTPELLYDYFKQYCNFAKANFKKEYVYNHKHDKQVGIDREIPLTWDGFEIWLRTNKIIVRLDDYKSNKDNRYSEYADIIHAINQEIYEDKFTGSVAGVFNPNIIARDLGLKEQTEATTNVNVKPIEWTGDENAPEV